MLSVSGFRTYGDPSDQWKWDNILELQRIVRELQEMNRALVMEIQALRNQGDILLVSSGQRTAE